LDAGLSRRAQNAPDRDAWLELVVAAGVAVCVCLERPVDPRFGFASVLFNDVHGAYAATARNLRALPDRHLQSGVPRHQDFAQRERAGVRDPHRRASFKPP
jgi:hypothetical protein